MLELGPALNFSYVSIMEDQHQGQTIWGWTLEGRRGGKWSELTHGGSIGKLSRLLNSGLRFPLIPATIVRTGHKRIISCTELSPSDRVAGVDAERARVEDPPAPPPQPSDVVFTHCDSANSWLVEGGGQIRNANRSSPSACLTLDGPASRFSFVSATACQDGASKQKWLYPQSKSAPNIAYDGGTVETTKMCIQINGDHPWVDHRGEHHRLHTTPRALGC